MGAKKARCFYLQCQSVVVEMILGGLEKPSLPISSAMSGKAIDTSRCPFLFIFDAYARINFRHQTAALFLLLEMDFSWSGTWPSIARWHGAVPQSDIPVW